MQTNRALSLGQFSLSASAQTAMVPGRWYLCYECHTCQQPIPVLACDEKASIALGGGGTMTMVCPQCAARHPYRVQELRKVQTPHAH